MRWAGGGEVERLEVMRGRIEAGRKEAGFWGGVVKVWCRCVWGKGFRGGREITVMKKPSKDGCRAAE